MAEKLTQYTGRFHLFTSNLREKWQDFRSEGTGDLSQDLKNKSGDKIQEFKASVTTHLNKGNEEDYSHIFRYNTRGEY